MRAVMALAVVSLVGALSGCAPEGSSGYVTFNVPPKSNCDVTPESDKYIAIGSFDIGTTMSKTFCKRSYFMHLVITSNLKANARDSTGRAEPNVLQISGAVVRLLDKDEQPLSFRDKNNVEDPARPNPFRVRTANTLKPASGSSSPSTGVIAVEAIPKSYAEKLTDFVGDSILAEVQVQGTTTGDVDIDFKPFTFPIQICRGCMSKCKSELPEDIEPEDVYGDQCADNAAADGRYCVDLDC